MLILLTILFYVVFLFFSLPSIYQFQIKDYDVDRLFSTIREERRKNTLYLIPMRMPGVKVRNMMIFTVVAVLLGIYYLLGYINYAEMGTLYAVYLLLGTVIAKFAVLVGVYFTAILAEIKRSRAVSAAKAKIAASDAVFIGITGSYGKSTVKEMVYQLLSAQYKTGKTAKNHNAPTGIAMSIVDELKPDTRYFVTEIGAYAMNVIPRSTKFVPLKIGVLTGLGNQHIDIFGSRDNLIEEKSKLLAALPEDGRAYVNMDCDGYEKAVAATKAEAVTYSVLDAGADIYAGNISHSSEGSKADVKYKDWSFSIESRLLGEHNILNLLPAVGIALDEGVDIEEVKRVILEIKPLPGKLMVQKDSEGRVYVDDAYSSNTDGFKAGLKVLGDFPQGRKIAITQGLIELGEYKLESYREIIEVAESVGVEIWTTDLDFNSDNEGVIRYFESLDELKEGLEKIDIDTVVLIEGRFPPAFINSLKLNDV